MSRLFFPATLALILAFSSLLSAQQIAPSGDFHSWTKEDVRKILIDSPWSRTIDWRAQSVDTRQVGTIVLPIVTAKILLRSALPVRQAMLRSRQLEAKYDKMTPAEKQEFDAKNKALIDCPACASYYVVAVSSRYLSMENQTYVRERKQSVYLSNEAGDRRELAEMSVPPGGENEIIFFFPRLNEKGAALITRSNTKLTFNFELKGLDGKSTFPFEKFDFKVADLVKDETVQF
jgi:hypothetical protein